LGNTQRQTLLPLVTRTTKALSGWLGSSGALTFTADLDQVDALAPEREALWARLEKSSFLTDAEKRLAIGYPAEPDLPASKLFNPSQPRDDAGRWTSDGGGDIIPVGGRGGGRTPPKPPAPPPTQPAKPPATATAPPKKLEDILKPGGNEIGGREGRASPGIRTVSPSDFDNIERELLAGAREVPAPSIYEGRWFERADGTIVGTRNSSGSGPTLEVIQGRNSGFNNGYKVHRK
jgi:hypothetical protein